jgi:rhodanese-related sulfurtransferase
VSFDFKLKPYEHQLREFEEHRDDPFRALLWQMRTGKTKPVIDTAAHLWLKGKLDGVLVIAPNGVHDNWVLREMQAHCPVPWAAHAWHSIDCSRHASDDVRERHRIGMRRVTENDDTELSMFAINAESLIVKDLQAAVRKFMSGKRVMLVADESHYFGRPGSRRTRLARGLAKRCAFRRILTGTAVSNSPLKAFSQFELLEPGALGFKTYADFKAAFSYQEYGGPFPRTIYRNLDELRDLMAEWSSVVLREDCDGLPDLIEGRRYFDLHPEQRKAYDRLKSGVFLELSDGSIATPADAGAAIIKLQQITSSYIRDEDGDYKEVSRHNPRVDTFMEELEESGPTVVWCRFRREIAAVADKLRAKGMSFVEYHGGVSTGKRQGAIDRFQAGGASIFLGQPQAGGMGIDLSKADTVLWYSHTFDAEIRKQASERATAVGGRHVALTDLVARNTVDEYILEAIARKGSVAADLAGPGLRDRLAQILGD